MVKRLFAALLFLLLAPAVFAAYKFEVVQNYSVYDIQTDGSVQIRYSIKFKNAGQPIDIVDIGLPDDNYDLSSGKAKIDGNVLNDIRKSTYLPSGVEVHLENLSIPAGKEGTLEFSINTQDRVYEDDKDLNYASTEFMPTYYGSEFTSGTTKLGCQFIFPKGVLPEEPRYHMNEPTKSFVNDEGRVVYVWVNENASPSTGYEFGASFPRKYVTHIIKKPVTPPILTFLGGIIGGFFNLIFGNMPCFCVFIFISFVVTGIVNDRRRRIKYLPATVGMDGVEVRRGLTVPEVAALMEQPLNKILALMLFGMIRKGYVKVATQKPLKLEKTTEKIPEISYEKEFLNAVADDGVVNEKEAVAIMTDLVKRVGEKMKGFSRKKSLAYYQEIMKKAWDQVGSENYSESFEWLMIDKDFEQEATRRYPTGNVPVPMIFGPIFHSPSAYGGGTPVPTSSGGGIVSSAHSIVSGIEGFSNNLAGSLPGLATKVTNATNPVPVSTGGGGHSGGGCACACACAGCACACAGGGR
jgi:hypothetical protein